MAHYMHQQAFPALQSISFQNGYYEDEEMTMNSTVEDFAHSLRKVNHGMEKYYPFLEQKSLNLAKNLFPTTVSNIFLAV